MLKKDAIKCVMSIFKHQENSLSLGPEFFRYYSAFLNQNKPEQVKIIKQNLEDLESRLWITNSKWVVIRAHASSVSPRACTQGVQPSMEKKVQTISMAPGYQLNTVGTANRTQFATNLEIVFPTQKLLA